MNFRIFLGRSTKPNCLKIYDFLIMSNEDQMAQVMLHGTFVTKLTTHSKIYVLYSLNTFFFEMVFAVGFGSATEQALLLNKHVFGSGVRLEKYLEADLTL